MEPKVGVRYGKTLTQGPCHDALHTVQVNNNKNAGKKGQFCSRKMIYFIVVITTFFVFAIFLQCYLEMGSILKKKSKNSIILRY